MAWPGGEGTASTEADILTRMSATRLESAQNVAGNIYLY